MGLVLLLLRNEPMMVGGLNETTQESTGNSCRYSSGASDHSEEGVSVRLGWGNDAGGQGCPMKPVPASWIPEV